MTDTSNLSHALASYIQSHPYDCRRLLRLLCSLALRQFSAEYLRMLAAECPEGDQAGYVVKAGLHTRALERDTHAVGGKVDG